MATPLKIGDGLQERVQRLASQRRRSAHWIMLDATEQYVEREEARERFRNEAEASWSAYQASGRHLTGKEVGVWLDSRGTDDEASVPPCHKESSSRRRQAAWSCRPFLAAKAPEAARRAGQAIKRPPLVLETTPDIGRPLPEAPELRELLIAFGDAGYVTPSRHVASDEAVRVPAFRFQKGAGY